MTDIIAQGTQSAPTAGAAVAQTASLPAGRYLVWVSSHLEGSGTPAAADLDNLALYVGTTEVGVISVPEAKSVQFCTPEIVVTISPGAGAAIIAQAVGNATASVTYAVSMVVRQDARFLQEVAE